MRAVLLDPARLDRVATAPAIDDEQPSERDELNARRRKRYWHSRGQALLAYLPEVEREMVELHHLRGCPHSQIAALYGISQPAVSRHLTMAMRRLQWLASWPGVGLDQEEFAEALDHRLPHRIIVLLWTLIETTNQSEAARATGYTQPTACRRIHAALDALRGKPELRRYYLTVRAVMESPNMLHKRPEASAPFRLAAAE